MLIDRHRQHLDRAIGKFEEAVGVVGEPGVFLLTLPALRRQEFEQDFFKLVRRGHHRHTTPG
jgi:hypothetical protein